MTPNRKPRTLLNRWASCFGHLWTVTVGVFALGIVLHMSADVPPVSHPDVVDSPATLFEAHDCWTGEAPADVADQVPAKVLVTLNGRARIGGPKLVDKALGQLFDGEDHNMTVHAFCR